MGKGLEYYIGTVNILSFKFSLKQNQLPHELQNQTEELRNETAVTK